jgi:hypothetical protein
MRHQLPAIAVLTLLSFESHAQLTSVDRGLALEDSSGLEFANTVGVNLEWDTNGAPYSIQGWIASLNAEDYGGYNNWTLATESMTSNTGQLTQLLQSDCGGPTSTTIQAKCSNFTALSAALNSTYTGLGSGAVFLSGTGTPNAEPDLTFNEGINYANAAYISTADYGGGHTVSLPDTQIIGDDVSIGDAIAVREAPELDTTTSITALTFLAGAALVLNGSRRART